MAKCYLGELLYGELLYGEMLYGEMLYGKMLLSPPLSLPSVPLTKKLGAVRWCVDQVNKVTVTDSYPTPNISNILDSVGFLKIFQL